MRDGVPEDCPAAGEAEAELELEQRRGNEGRRSGDPPRAAGHDVELVDLLAAVTRAACQATGMTEEELLAEAARLQPPPLRVDPLTPSQRRMKAARTPELHMRHLAHPTECDALARVRDFVADERRHFLVLAGVPGTQKTGSACYMLGELERGAFVRAADLLDLRFAEDKAPYFELQRARAVVLDDLGAEGPDEKGHKMATLISLFDAWYGNCAKVVVTYNLLDCSPEEERDLNRVARDRFKAAYDPRIVDRIRESGPRSFVVLGGQSVRAAMGKSA